jgi:hypothetical protein
LVQRVTDPLLLELTQEHRYLTRLLGRISPEEMTVDPVFMFDGQRPNFSNVRDLSTVNAEVFWGCQQGSLPKEGGFALAIAMVFGLSTWRWRLKRNSK